LTEDKVLHTDSDGHKVEWEVDEAGNRTGYIRYDRYPDVRYAYLTALQAAAKILKGEVIEHCYIEALTVDALAAAENEHPTGQFLPIGSIGVDGEKRERPVLKPEIRCLGCLIGEINLRGLIFESHASFSLPGSYIDRAFIFGKADLWRATFCGDAYFGGATFSGETQFEKADFTGDADFEGATFSGDAHFWSSTFGGEAVFFKSARFGGEADFSLATFRRTADFGKASFDSYGGFMGTRFGGNVSFETVTFRCVAFFNNARFSANAHFLGATFGARAHFCGATFDADATFRDATFNGDTSFWDAKFSGKAEFRGACALSFSLNGTRFETLCDMKEIAAARVNLEETIYKEGVLLSTVRDSKQLKARQEQIWQSLRKRKNDLQTRSDRIRDSLEKPEEKYDIPGMRTLLRDWLCLIRDRLKPFHDWRESNRGIYTVNFKDTLVQGELDCEFRDLSPSKTGLPVIKPHREGKWDEARKQYAWLKEQFRKRGAYRDEDEAHWWASECARKARKAKWPLRVGVWFLYRKVFGYGVKPINVVITIAVVIAICSGFFCWAYATGKIMSDSGSFPFASAFFNGLYFSVITFATVGYGDVRAIGWAAGLAMVEGLLGIGLNAALVVVIFRKLVR